MPIPRIVGETRTLFNVSKIHSTASFGDGALQGKTAPILLTMFPSRFKRAASISPVSFRRRLTILGPLGFMDKSSAFRPREAELLKPEAVIRPSSARSRTISETVDLLKPKVLIISGREVSFLFHIKRKTIDLWRALTFELVNVWCMFYPLNLFVLRTNYILHK